MDNIDNTRLFSLPRGHVKLNLGTSLVVQWLRICLSMQGVWVRSLVGELGSHMPHGQKKTKQNIKQKQCCRKFSGDFENGPHQKKKKKNL